MTRLPLLPLLLLLLLTTTVTPTTATCTAAGTPPATVNTTTAATGASELGLKLFRQLGASLTSTGATAGVRNVLLSPYSVWMVLTLAYIGAEGNTEAELASALGFESKEGVYSLLSTYQTGLIDKVQADPNVTLDSATRLYIDAGFTLTSCGTELANDVVAVGFSTEPAQAAVTINQYVNATTQGLIPEIVTRNQLGATTKLVAVNAVYMKGAWRLPFNANKTEKGRFFSFGETQSYNVDMMVLEGAFVRVGHSRDLRAQVLELPYSSGVLNMTIILPGGRKADGFRRTVNALSVANLTSALNSLEEDTYDVFMPKFEITSEFADEMKKALAGVGVKDLFSQSAANLTSFSPELYVKHFLHKTVVKVDEEGTEAAGATAAVFVTKIKKTVRLDHPFIFIIHDTDTIFFIGTYVKP